jgi:RNA polymerase sigma-70 factor (sigma-E family)
MKGGEAQVPNGAGGAIKVPATIAAERRRIFEQVVQDDGRRMAQLAFCLCNDRAQAEDLVSGAYARTWRRWETGQVDELVPYLRRTLVNLARKSWRRELLFRRYLTRSSVDLAVGQDLVREVELVDAVLRLPSRQRAVMVLRYFEDLNEEQTAQLLGVAVGTVKSRTSRALASLRATFEGDLYA